VILLPVLLFDLTVAPSMRMYGRGGDARIVERIFMVGASPSFVALKVHTNKEKQPTATIHVSQLGPLQPSWRHPSCDISLCCFIPCG
jgi:hypothetical protein